LNTFHVLVSGLVILGVPDVPAIGMISTDDWLPILSVAIEGKIFTKGNILDVPRVITLLSEVPLSDFSVKHLQQKTLTDSDSTCWLVPP